MENFNKNEMMLCSWKRLQCGQCNRVGWDEIKQDVLPRSRVHSSLLAVGNVVQQEHHGDQTRYDRYVLVHRLTPQTFPMFTQLLGSAFAVPAKGK